MSTSEKMLRGLGVRVPRGTVIHEDPRMELPPKPDKWLTSKEAIPLYGRHFTTFYQAASAGKIKTKTSDGNKLYDRASILALVAKRAPSLNAASSRPSSSKQPNARDVAAELVKRTGSQRAAAKAAGVANVVIYRALNEPVSNALFEKLTKALATIKDTPTETAVKVETLSQKPREAPLDGLVSWIAEGKKHDYFSQCQKLEKLFKS